MIFRWVRYRIRKPILGLERSETFKLWYLHLWFGMIAFGHDALREDELLPHRPEEGTCE